MSGSGTIGSGGGGPGPVIVRQAVGILATLAFHVIFAVSSVLVRLMLALDDAWSRLRGALRPLIEDPLLPLVILGVGIVATLAWSATLVWAAYRFIVWL